MSGNRDALISGPIVATLMRLTLPVIAVTAAQTFVAVLEAYWVSRLGTAAVAGIALVIPLYVLMNTMSNGGIGGGVSSAVARAIGAGQADQANQLLFHAVLIALGFGALFTAAFIVFGKAIYTALGGSGGSLHAALAYSAWVFGAAPVIWMVNLIGSAMRGAGDVKLPAVVSLTGAAVLVPLSPALIFGIGPLPRLGIAGAGAATVLYYLAALAIYAVSLWRGRGALRLCLGPVRRDRLRDILGVGLISAFGTLAASLTVVGVTGAVGTKGAGALAGFGIASRVDSLLVPLLFGLGSGVVTMVGIATGAGDHARAKAITLRAAFIAVAIAQMLGALLAFMPGLWMAPFTKDVEVLGAGSAYLRIVAPFYGFFGLGLMLYFASQGFSRMLWPFIAGGVRLAATVGMAFWAAREAAPPALVFAAVSVGSVLFGLINLAGFLRIMRRYGTGGSIGAQT